MDTPLTRSHEPEFWEQFLWISSPIIILFLTQRARVAFTYRLAYLNLSGHVPMLLSSLLTKIMLTYSMNNLFLVYLDLLRIIKQIQPSNYGPNIYKDTKPQMSSLLVVFNRVYRLEIHSVMLVFSTLLWTSAPLTFSLVQLPRSPLPCVN